MNLKRLWAHFLIFNPGNLGLKKFFRLGKGFTFKKGGGLRVILGGPPILRPQEKGLGKQGVGSFLGGLFFKRIGVGLEEILFIRTFWVTYTFF